DDDKVETFGAEDLDRLAGRQLHEGPEHRLPGIEPLPQTRKVTPFRTHVPTLSLLTEPAIASYRRSRRGPVACFLGVKRHVGRGQCSVSKREILPRPDCRRAAADARTECRARPYIQPGSIAWQTPLSSAAPSPATSRPC